MVENKYLVNNKSTSQYFVMYPLLAMRGQTFSVSLHKLFTHCCWYFGPFVHADLLHADLLHSRYGVLWMQLGILSPPNTTSWVFTKKFYFVFIWPYDILPILFWICSLANFRRAWTCTGLSRGTRLALQDLSPWRRSVLLMVAFVTLVPALCRSFTRSPRVVLGFLFTVLVIILTPRGEILRGAPDGGRLSVVLYVFHFLIIAPTVDFFTPSCLPIADSVFPAWCRSTILFLVSCDNLKKKLQVCESQKSCLFVGDQILILLRNLPINSFKILQCDFLDSFPPFCLS